MSRKKNITDKAFREPLKNYQKAPPEEVWTGISGALDQDRRKGRMIWMGRIAAAAALVIAAGSIWVLLQRSPSTEIGKTETTEEVSGQESLQSSEGDESGNRTTGESQEESVNEFAGKIREESGVEQGIKPASESGNEGLLAVETTEVVDRFETVDRTVSGPDEEAGPEKLVRKSIFSIPAQYPEPALVLAQYEPVEEFMPDEEGIDVFEEFGEEGTPKFDRWALGGQVTPLYSYRDLGSSQPQALYSSSQLNDIESGIVSYAGGFNLNYSPARRLSLQSGLYYSRLGMSVRDVSIASIASIQIGARHPAALAMSNSSGDIQLGAEKANSAISNIWTSTGASFDNAAPVETSSSNQDIKQGDILQHFEYIELPMILRYRVVDRRAGINLLGGLSTNFLVGSNVYFQEGGSREYIGTTENIKPVNYSSVLGVGFQYSIKQNLHFNLEPTFRYYLNSINTGSGIGSHPYSLGFFTGISYSF